MAQKKKSTIPGPAGTDLYTLKFPTGGVTAKFWRTTELTAARSRELDVYRFHLLPRISEVASAAIVRTPDGETLANPSDEQRFMAGVAHLTRDEVRDFFEMNDIAAIVYLKSWTAKREGEPLPVPETTDELRLLPRALYDPLVQRAAEIFRTDLDGDFGLDGMEDEQSPTTA